jgi:hypothetical protein
MASPLECRLFGALNDRGPAIASMARAWLTHRACGEKLRIPDDRRPIKAIRLAAKAETGPLLIAMARGSGSRRFVRVVIRRVLVIHVHVVVLQLFHQVL